MSAFSSSSSISSSLSECKRISSTAFPNGPMIFTKLRLESWLWEVPGCEGDVLFAASRKLSKRREISIVVKLYGEKTPRMNGVGL